MQFIKSILAICFFVLPFLTKAQSDYISLNDKDYQLIDRLDIKLRNDSVLRFSTVKPFNRQIFTQRIEHLYTAYTTKSSSLSLSKVDKYDIENFLKNNADWTISPAYHFNSYRKSNYAGLFATPYHLYADREKDFNIVIDPVMDIEAGKSTQNSENIFINTRGVLIRGQIGRKLGFYTYLSDNQERDPQYVQDFVTQNNALPGQGFFKAYNGTGYDYFNGRGGIIFNTGKFFDLQFAYDKLFIGNGYRSLFLSDFSSNYLYLRFAAHVGRIHYETIVAETTAPFLTPVQSQHQALPNNFLAIHHLSWQMTKRFNIGLYENAMENGSDGFKIGYLNPIIFYKALEQDYGIAGKTNIGFDFKWSALKNIQLYGQLEFNEFLFNEIIHYSKGSWENKQGAQLGFKYIDALGIKNLNLQMEGNIVRPYTYTNSDSSTGFTNYNQPLAHPLGANFREAIAILKYHPFPKWYATAKLFYHEQGLDTAGKNFGDNIFRSYNSRTQDYGVFIGTGQLVKSMLASFTLSYELIPDFFIEGNTSYRTFNVINKPPANDFFYTFGMRWNIARRDFEF